MSGAKMKNKTGNNVEKNLKRATSSFVENTLPIFFPVKNIHKTKAYALFKQNNGSLKIKTTFGALEIRGRILGQNHKDILEMLLCQRKILIRKDDSIAVNFGRYAFLQDLGRSTGNYKWLEERIKEIRDFNFSITYKTQDDKIMEVGGFGIIDKYKFEENGTMSVKFTEEFTNFYREENLLDYAKYVPKIAKMKEPFLKAVVREMLKHKKYQIHFSKLIENFRYNNLLSETEIKKYKSLLKNEENRKYLAENFNILVEKVGRDYNIKIDRDANMVTMLINSDNFIKKQDEIVTFNQDSLFGDDL